MDLCTCDHGKLFRLILPRVAFSDEGCWLWTGNTNDQGYGLLLWNERSQRAHRLMYEIMVGPIPEGLVLDHLCRVRNCVRPDHLDPVTQGENTRRGMGFVGVNFRRTVCANGHPFDEANTYICPNGWRRCRRCRTLGMRAASRKKAEAR